MEKQLEEKCFEFGKVLGLENAVSREVLVSALEDKTYAHNLLVSRKQPAFLNHLLANPPKLKVVEPVAEEISNIVLVGKVAKALVRWSKTGFSIVDDETLEKRETACLECSNLQSPQKLIQKMAASKKVSDKIGSRILDKSCSLCGCNAGRKIRLPSESCPDTHPDLAGMTRWGEPIRLGE